MSRERVDISLPAAGKLVLVGAGVLLVALVVLLTAMLSVLSDSREHIVAQDRKINRIVKGADPVLGQVQPVADDARALLKQGTPFVRELRATMIPLLRDLRGARLGSAAQVVARLAASLDQNGRLVSFVALGSDLVRGLRDSEFIPRTLRAADVVPEMKRILAQSLDVQRTTLSTQLRTLGIQRRTFRLQRQSRDIQRRTLAIQEEALAHIRSIDRKTGPPVPAAPVPAPVPQR